MATGPSIHVSGCESCPGFFVEAGLIADDHEVPGQVLSAPGFQIDLTCTVAQSCEVSPSRGFPASQPSGRRGQYCRPWGVVDDLRACSYGTVDRCGPAATCTPRTHTGVPGAGRHCGSPDRRFTLQDSYFPLQTWIATGGRSKRWDLPPSEYSGRTVGFDRSVPTGLIRPRMSGLSPAVSAADLASHIRT